MTNFLKICELPGNLHLGRALGGYPKTIAKTRMESKGAKRGEDSACFCGCQQACRASIDKSALYGRIILKIF